MKLCWFRYIEQDFPLWDTWVHKISHWQIFDVIEQRMSEVRNGTSRNTENENKRCKIFNKVLNMNWDYVRVKRKQKENKNKQTNKNK